MSQRAYTSFYARQSATASREAAQARAEANLFRGLLAETDARLRQAWAAGRLPVDVIPDDLIERTRAALAGEQQPMSTDQLVAEAVQRLAALSGKAA